MLVNENLTWSKVTKIFRGEISYFDFPKYKKQ